MSESTPDFVGLTADIVSAYVAKNSVPAGELPNAIASIYAALRGLNEPQQPEPARLTPPMPIKKSVTPDYIISFEDGRQYKSLKRHLNTRGLTPDQYRAKWGLDKSYPMVAPNYAKARSELAKSMGLGRKAADTTAAASTAVEAANAPEEAAKKQARRKKAA